MRELVAIDSALHVHKNCCHHELLCTASSSNFVSPLEAKKCELVALLAECILNVDADSGHKSIEAQIIDCQNPFHHSSIA
jgi:hypothetical protein